MNNQILFAKSYLKSQVLLNFMPTSKRLINSNLELAAQKEWEKIKSLAAAEGKKLWDQPLYRLEGFRTNPNWCKLSIAVIPYSIRYALNSFTPELLSLGKKYYPMGCYSSTFIETVDSKFVFICKSSKYLSNRKISFVGGTFSTETQTPKSDALFTSVAKEIYEEIGLKVKTQTLGLIGAFINQTCNTCFVFYLKLRLAANELEKLFTRANTDGEADSLIFVDKSSLGQFITTNFGMNDQIISIYQRYKRCLK